MLSEKIKDMKENQILVKIIHILYDDKLITLEEEQRLQELVKQKKE